MRSKKIFIFVGLFLLQSWFLIKLTEESELLSLYNGILFNGRQYYYGFCFWGFSLQLFYIFSEFECILKNEGIYIVLRNRSRYHLYTYLIRVLTKSVFLLQLIKLISYGILSFLVKGNLQIGNIRDFILYMFLDLLTCFVMLLIQMLLEIFIDGKTALIISLAYYLLSVVFANFIYSITNQIMWFIPFIPNLSMKLRVDELNVNFYFLIAILLCIAGVILLLGKSKFMKKDMI